MIIFSSQAEVILSNPLPIVLIAIPLILQTFLIFFVAYGAAKLLRLPFDIAAPAGMIGASNFFELAVAVSIALFGTTSPATLATTVGVLTEVPIMLTLVKIANSTKDWNWGNKLCKRIRGPDFPVNRKTGIVHSFEANCRNDKDGKHSTSPFPIRLFPDHIAY